MAVATSEIRRNVAYRNGTRKVHHEHIDDAGERHYVVSVVPEGTDVDAFVAAHAAYLDSGPLARKEVSRGIEAVVDGRATLRATTVHHQSKAAWLAAIVERARDPIDEVERDAAIALFSEFSDAEIAGMHRDLSEADAAAWRSRVEAYASGRDAVRGYSPRG